MEEVDPLHLIPGETYYFEYKDLRDFYDSIRCFKSF